MNNRTIIGILILLGSFWGGAYFMQLTVDTWAMFPTLATSFLFAIIGILLAAGGLSDGESN